MPGNTSERHFRKLLPTTPSLRQLLLFWLLTIVLPLAAILVILNQSELGQIRQLKTALTERMFDKMNELLRECNAEAYFKTSILGAETAAGLPPRHSNLFINEGAPANIASRLQSEFAAIKGFQLVMLITGKNDFSDIEIYHDSASFADYPRPGQWAARILLKAIAARIRGISTKQELSAVEQRMLRNFTESIFGTYFNPVEQNEDFIAGFNVRNGGSNLHTARRLVQNADKTAGITYLAIFAETPAALREGFRTISDQPDNFKLALVLRPAKLYPLVVENYDTSVSLYAPLSYSSLNTAPHSKNNYLNRLLKANKSAKELRYPHLVLTSAPLRKLSSQNFLYARFAIFLSVCLSLLALRHFHRHGLVNVRIRGRLFAAVLLATILPASAFLFMAYRHNHQQTLLRQSNLTKEMKTRLRMFELNLRSQDEMLGRKATDLAADMRKNLWATDNEFAQILEKHVRGYFDGAMTIRSNGHNYEIIDPKSVALSNNPEQLAFSRDIFFASIIKFFDYLRLTSVEFYARLETTPYGKKLKALSAIFSREDVENFCSYEGTAQTSKKGAATLRFINYKILPAKNNKDAMAAVILLALDIRRVVEIVMAATANDWSFYNHPGKEGIIKTVMVGTYDLDASSIDATAVWPKGTLISHQQLKLINAVARGKGEISRVISNDSAPPVAMVARKIGGYPLIAVSQCVMHKMSTENSHTEFFLTAWLAYLLLILSILASILDELFAAPIQKLLAAARLTGEGHRVELISGFANELSQLTAEFNDMNRCLKERERLKRFVSNEAVEVIARESIELCDIAASKERRSILFMHLRGFDKLSESLRPEQLIELLNQYFPFAEKIIEENLGHIDKYIADAVMAVFPDNETSGSSAVRACASALAIKQRAVELNSRLTAEGLPAVITGAGIATGEVIAGRIGASSGRRDYTVIGDTVNLAARLEAMSHFSDDMRILVDQPTMEEAAAGSSCKNHGEMPVKGKAAPVQIYELLGSG
ncbi:MAG: hypothetical protein CVV42_08630 [Candidatus Riflebacteria bacterium HGW-Riflebacteria-2]|jgi:class 3 adenylate cyclase|nr:MAG: hypothetical protein CVV42_08630 [Candidatus Riflebacteria bacterium HGW-Riflebacteria-2]